MTTRRLHPLPRKPGTSFTDPSAMSSFRRSLMIWSLGFASGDFIINLKTGDYTSPLISFPSASHEPRSTRLHNSSLPRHHLRLPGRYTSPPVLSEDLSSEKTKWSRHRRSTWLWRRIPNVRTFCFPDAPPNTFSNRSTRGFINGHLQLSFALPKIV